MGQFHSFKIEKEKFFKWNSQLAVDKGFAHSFDKKPYFKEEELKKFPRTPRVMQIYPWANL